MNKIVKQTLFAIKTFNLIEDNDIVAVGLSGGKDSLVLLDLLDYIRKYILNFKLISIIIDLGFSPEQDFTQIKKRCFQKDIPLFIKHTLIYNIVFKTRREKNPCSLCSKMRGAALHDEAKRLGATKIALGHHRDDAVETFVMNLLNEGRIGCFKPKTWLSHKEITLIRPLCFVKEQSIIAHINSLDIDAVKNPCPADTTGNRQDTKELLKLIKTKRPSADLSIFNVIKNDWYEQI